MQAKDFRHAAQRAAAGKMPVAVIYALEAVEVHQEDGKRPVGPSRSFQLSLQDIHEVPVIGQARQAVTDGKSSHLAEELRIVQQRGPEKNATPDGVEQLRPAVGASSKRADCVAIK